MYCVAGLPFDAVSLTEAGERVREAAFRSEPCFISTPNLNFVVTSQGDSDFRESVCQSDLSLADGMPVVWMAKMLGLPVRERVSGSDLFSWLSNKADDRGRKLNVYFFGGVEGVARRASDVLNSTATGLRCVGYEYPGYGSVPEMSSAESIERINASGADILIASLGARKGQEWIVYNRERINTPVISHLGAVVNFIAGTIDRAPRWMQRCGLEWLWRIKEEPALWSRYWHDGMGLSRMLFLQIIPYAVWLRCSNISGSAAPEIELKDSSNGLSIKVSGSLCSGNLDEVRIVFRHAAELMESVALDMRCASYIDSAFLGLTLVLRKHVTAAGGSFRVVHVPPRLRKVFSWCGAGYLLAGGG